MRKDIVTEAIKSCDSFCEDLEKEFKAINEANDQEREELQEQLMDVLEIATGKDFNGTRTYMILLGTGGPAMRITGELDEYDMPASADYQYQDWGTEWTSGRPNSEQEKLLVDFASLFYFGE